MGKLNVRVKTTVQTHEGAKTFEARPEEALRRSVLSCLLWEDGFYEEGQTIADRIASLIPKVKPEVVAALAVEARTDMKLRHVPLLIVREMARLPSHKPYVRATLAAVVQRADELAEFMAIYWKDGRTPISAQVKKGLAAAFTKFSEYDLAKYDREGKIRLRDVLFMVHAKPKDPIQATLWKALVNKELKTPDTWEVALSASAGENKKEIWDRLLAENKLGALALLRNLRNMEAAGVDRDKVRAALAKMKTERVLPYRFISAAKHAPQLEPELKTVMLSCLDTSKKLGGRTALLIDVSGSMSQATAGDSDITPLDAACALAILMREMGAVDVFTFSEGVKPVPARRGFALRDAIVNSQPHGGTYLGAALKLIPKGYDRIVVITDEQSADIVGAPPATRGYMVNVESNKNGVGYGEWNRITGWSESIARYVVERETASTI